MEDFASTALFNLVATELGRQGFDASPKSHFAGKTAPTEKREVLRAALDELGTAGILKIGAGIEDFPAHPTLAVLRKARDPRDLIERWQRLEGYYHGRHRVRYTPLGETGARLEHYSKSEEAPSEGEDLLIAGLLATLLQMIGVSGLSLHIAGVVCIDHGRVVENCPRLRHTAVWDLVWEDYAPRAAQPVPTTAGPGEQLQDRLRELIRRDPGRGWRLATAARELATSPRTLQRRLTAGGVTFQALLRQTRADSAAAELQKGRHDLAEIGYTCGFSDQAHFSREFKLRFNMAPSDYLSLAR